MATYYSPKIVTDGLVFCLDAASRNGISALGCGGFNGAPQLVKNMASPSDVITDVGGVRLGNLTYYTAFAIDYPEGNYGGDAAGRHGITPGYNVRSGGKTYDTSRALHLYAWNNVTSSWIEGEFNGARLSGHCYDNYTGAETGYANELAKFVTDYNNVKTKYPDVTFIVIGSHRADRYTQAVRDILTDLGKPTGYIDSDYIAAPEWILIGKPGLGAGNYYGWAYENYTTNPSQVAHLNFGLPLFGSKDNYFLFDGVDDLITVASKSYTYNGGTWEMWVKLNSNNRQQGFMGANDGTRYINFWMNTNNYMRWEVIGNTSLTFLAINSTTAFNTGIWYHVVGTFNGVNNTIYVNGVAETTSTTGATNIPTTYTTPVYIGAYGAGSYLGAANIACAKIYNKALTAAEVLQNYNATKGRFGL